MAKKHPSPEMIKDLAKVFAKHNWSGQPIGILAKPPEFEGLAAEVEGDDCPPGKHPRWVTCKLKNGSWATKKICV